MIKNKKIKTYISIKDQLKNITKELILLIDSTKNIYNLKTKTQTKWNISCKNTEKQIMNTITRIAVTGTIKSGKSTLINAIFQKDLLKHGPGVTTSIITKIRPSSNDKVILCFKTWNQINNELNKAIASIPELNNLISKNNINIKHKLDRLTLKNSINKITQKQPINKSKNIMTILSYIEGFNKVKKYIRSEPSTIYFKENQVKLHHSFIDNDFTSIYIENIFIKINSTELGQNIEIADCQGSDSSNPLHLAMIQNYLGITNFIIYVVSTRTGIRQADIKLLSIIKKMGIIKNTVFIINSDINEYQSLKDLKSSIKKIYSNLIEICKIQPKLFIFSALLHLTNPHILLVTQKNKYSKIKNFSTKEYTYFKNFLKSKTKLNKNFLLLDNNTNRLKNITDSITNRINLNQNNMLKNIQISKQKINEIIDYHIELKQTEVSIKNAINATTQNIKKILFTNIDNFFEFQSNELTNEITNFIKKYQYDFKNHSEKNKIVNLKKIFTDTYQKFKQELNVHINENINKLITTFNEKQNIELFKTIESSITPYLYSLENNTKKHENNIKQFNLNTNIINTKKYQNIRSIQNIEKLSLPKIKISLHKQTKTKIKIIIQLNFYSLINYIINILKLNNIKNTKIFLNLIKKIIEKTKKEKKLLMIFHLKNYKENIKFQNIIRLTNNIKIELHKQTKEKLKINKKKLLDLKKIIEEQAYEKKRTLLKLKNINSTLKHIYKKLKIIKIQTKKTKDQHTN